MKTNSHTISKKPCRFLRKTSKEESTDITTFGKRLRFARVKAGLTQADLSALSFYNESYIVSLEKDKTRVPNRLEILAKALQVNPAWLLFGPKYANDVAIPC